MVRRIKSLTFNLEDGEEVRRHREHRSKKGRLKYRFSSEAYRLYKLKKKGML